MVTHAVSDVESWKAAFDAGQPVRARHGATAVRILRDNQGVVGLLEFPDAASAAGFLADPALRAPIEGVPNPPEVRLLSEFPVHPIE
jgi:hypothetical protein